MPEEVEARPSSPSSETVSAHGRFLVDLVSFAERLGNLSGKLGLMNKTGRNHRHTPILARARERLRECFGPASQLPSWTRAHRRLCGFSDTVQRQRRDAEERDIFPGFGCLCFAGALDSDRGPVAAAQCGG